jgi:hypothetical protein
LVFYRKIVKNNCGYWPGGASFGFGSFEFAIAGRGGSFEGLEKTLGSGDFVDGAFEGGSVGFGWFMEAGDFADELERGGADFLGCDRRIEIEKRFDAAAHLGLLEKSSIALAAATRKERVGGGSGSV